MMIDYHLHTGLCRHASGEPEEYARRALELGIGEIGFSCHTPMPPGYDPANRMRPEEFPRYEEIVRRCRDAFPRLPVKFGIETDFHPGTEDYARGVVEAHDFDYVIGSIHYLGSWGFDNPEQAERYGDRDVYDIYAEYYDRVAGLARSGLCDIVGHPDVIKKFGHRPSRDYEPLELRALEAVAAAGLALDVNTSGLRRPAQEIYPSLRILKNACRMGIGITFGSDAHEPAHVGFAFDRALALVREAGYTRFRRYARRKFDLVPLPAGWGPGT
jgi:histidinol-phosphatase (PHP family)